MGAAASMKHVYTDGMQWFRTYFDRRSYNEDFQQLDTAGDGLVTYTTLQNWIIHKAKDGSFWSTLTNSESILRIAFSIASKPDPNDPDRMVLGLSSFQEFLIHLFVLSVLWIHFKHADNWSDGVDLGTERLSYQKFKMACLTFSSAQAHEQLTEEKIKQDFDFLDVDKNGTIEFTEVCKYCSQFFHKDFASQFQTGKTHRELRPLVSEGTHVHDKSLRYIRTVRVPTGGSSTGVDAAGSGTGGDQTTDGGEGGTINTEETASATHNLVTASSKAHKAMDIIGEKIEQNAKIAAFQEIKISTEIMLGLSI